ncbi:MAG: hypothetical protein O8C56_05200 [Candidatus Methanoperedens sp.]|nr:hypothetical protein [Candidatus Methanoperedens sp.]
MGTFNFNLAQIIHAMMSGSFLEKSLQNERVNVLFDTNKTGYLL